MTSYDERLRSLREQASQAERVKIQMETKRDSALAQRSEIEQEVLALGIEPSQLETEIGKLATQIEAALNDIEAKLPATEV